MSKEKVCDRSLLDLDDGLQQSGIEQFAIRLVLDGDTDIFVPESIRQHCREYHAEQSRGKSTALLVSVRHRERVRCLSVTQQTGHHAVMELATYCNELIRASKLPHDPPEPLSADRVEGVVQVTMLPHALLLEFVGGEYCVIGPFTCSQATLALFKATLVQVL